MCKEANVVSRFTFVFLDRPLVWRGRANGDRALGCCKKVFDGFSSLEENRMFRKSFQFQGCRVERAGLK